MNAKLYNFIRLAFIIIFVTSVVTILVSQITHYNQSDNTLNPILFPKQAQAQALQQQVEAIKEQNRINQELLNELRKQNQKK